MTISTPAAIALLRLQFARPNMALLSLRLREDKPLLNANQAIAYIQTRYEHEKPAVDWWSFAEKIMEEQSHADN